MASVNKTCFTNAVTTAISCFLGIHIRKNTSILACDDGWVWAVLLYMCLLLLVDE